MHCKDCKHWGHPKKKYRSSLGNNCNKIEFEEACVPPKNGIIYYLDALDDTGLLFTLKTGPEFGCVNFEENV